ncbi:MAG: hypothetical protein JST54_05355 [Deltaproteobacteria bacterium]|nr:hypothetical protein [Deltaproteobacteria bacterium]
MRRLRAPVLMLLSGCASYNGPGMAVDAAINTAAAATASGAQRAQGLCYADCVYGTYCEPRTGTCEALPCHAACGEDEVCDERDGVGRCIPAAEAKAALDTKVTAKPDEPKPFDPTIKSAAANPPK